jgi:hypothetical protein
LQLILQWMIDDATLRERLLALTDRQALVAAVLGLASEHGWQLSAADVEAAMREHQRAWIERRIQ